ncbi:MAG: DUF1638 domain-containing protein [Candidatus Sumerlaeota bacterium]|nr:DUF1638 domain-containing protein [Candidatus Sumerlaeota bacterium]
MLLKLIACNVFMREACLCLAQSPHVIDPEFTELGEHIHSAGLRELIQGKIDAAEKSGKRYDAILVLYGLCGNSCVGIEARSIPLVIPRAHDCCTILLGSKRRFQDNFGDNPSMPFSCTGYMERGEYFMRVEDGESHIYYGDSYAALVEQYGEENAKYLWETMHPQARQEKQKKAVFIDLPETAHLGHAERFRAKAEAEGKEYQRLEGSLRLIRNLIFGQWDSEDFLTVLPGQKTTGVYDWSEIIRAKQP